MAVDTWPATLPPLVLGTSFGLGEGTLREPTATGPPVKRPRFTATVDPVSVPLRLSATQLETLVAFYKTTLSHGALRFNHTHPVSLVVVEMGFRQPPTGFTAIVGSADAGTRRYAGVLELEVYP